MINLEIPDALHPVFIGEARYRVAYGGRGSSKSWAFARMLLLRAYQKRTRILCARELQNSIKDSVHKLLSDQIHLLKLPGFQVGESFIRHVNGSEFIFRGLRTNASEIKSMEGIDICWVEEAQGVSRDSWELLIPTIRTPGSEIWVTLNPLLESDATSQRFIENPPPGAIVRRINWSDNPWFPPELASERDYLKGVDFESYKNVWEGEYKDPNKGGRVVPTWSFANVQEVEYLPTHRIYLTCDFNVDPMCWGVAHVFMLDGKRQYHFFDEIAMENTNIIEATREFSRRYGQHKAGIIVTGDASGRQRTDGTPDPNQTRYDLLQKSLSDFGCTKYALDVARANPQRESRIELFSRIVCDPDGERRVKVDPKCKQIIRVCERLSFIPGSDKVFEPTPKMIEKDRRLKFDRADMFDAVSYLICRYDPKIERPPEKKQRPLQATVFKPTKR